MKKILLIVMLMYVQQAYAQCKLDYSEYVVVLDEEFDNYGGSASTMFATGPWRGTIPNEPNWGKGVEIYNPNQVSLIPDGNGGHRLLLTATKQPGPYSLQRTLTDANGNSYLEDVAYESGMLTLKDDFVGDPVTLACQPTRGYAYGMFEIRCKMPHSGNMNGTSPLWDAWPAFWTINIGAEIDIIDNITNDHRDYWQSGMIDWRGQPWFPGNTDWVQVPYNPADQVYDISNSYNNGDRVQPNDPADPNGWKVSFRAQNNTAGNTCGMFSYSHFRNLANEFHTYTAVWTPEKVTFFFDGREIYTVPAATVSLPDCPANIIADLQIFPSANTLSEGAVISWEIDYIKVYKPKGPHGNGTDLTVGDYIVTPFKNDHDFVNHNTMGDIKTYTNTTGLTKVKTNPRSIAFDGQDPTQVFYAGEDGRLYDVIDVAGDQKWPTLKKIGMNHTPNFPAEEIDGDLIFDETSSKFLYRGNDGRIQYYLYTTGGWIHGYIDNNWSTSQFLVSSSKASIGVSKLNGSIFYKGTDDKIHYFANGNGSAHAWIGHNYVANSSQNHYVKNDVILEDLGNYTNVIYKGNDDRMQIFWVDISQNPPQYQHAYIDNSGITSWKVKSDPGCMTLGELGEVFYIGIDNRIQRYYFTATGWVHEDLANSAGYSYNSVGYPNGDYARNGITYDKVNRRVLYVGNDGRIQYFGLDNGNWYHSYRDDYWNTLGFSSFNDQNTDDYPSIIHDENFDRTYYIGNYNYDGSNSYKADTANPPANALLPYDHQKHLRYFTYEPCEVITECAPNTAVALRKPGKNIPATTSNGISEDELLCYPNPSSTGVFNIKDQAFKGTYAEVINVEGKVIYKTESLDGRIDISSQPSGVYILLMKTEMGVYRQRLVVNK